MLKQCSIIGLHLYTEQQVSFRRDCLQVLAERRSHQRCAFLGNNPNKIISNKVPQSTHSLCSFSVLTHLRWSAWLHPDTASRPAPSVSSPVSSSLVTAALVLAAMLRAIVGEGLSSAAKSADIRRAKSMSCGEETF